MKTIGVVLADDHRLFRNGLMMLLEGEAGIEVLGEAANGKELLRLLETLQPDVVLMDIEMPEMDGVAATEEIGKKHPEVKIISLSMYGDENYYYRMIEAGAKGFILKDSDICELTRAIRTVHSGGTYFSQEILYQVVKNIREVSRETPALPSLSPRELEVVREICRGLSNQEIAGKLHISPRTVEKHRASLLVKTQTKNTASLVMYAVENRLIDTESGD